MKLVGFVKDREGRKVAACVVNNADKLIMARCISQELEEFGWDEDQSCENAINVLYNALYLYKDEVDEVAAPGVKFDYNGEIDLFAKYLVISNLFPEANDNYYISSLPQELERLEMEENISLGCVEDLSIYDEDYRSPY